MKKQWTLLILAIGSVTLAKAQTFHPTVKMGASGSLSEPGAKCHALFNADFALNDYLRLGPSIGLGAEYYEEDDYFDYHGRPSRYNYSPHMPTESVYSIPLYANIKYLIIPRQKVTPYIFASLGYTFCITDNHRDPYARFGGELVDDLGLMAGGGVGIDIPLRRGSIQAEVTMTMQHVDYIDNYEAHNTFLGLTIGYSFGRRLPRLTL